MKINIQSIKFDADKKLIKFIETKTSKLGKFYDEIIGAQVFLRLENSPTGNKKAEIRLEIPGNDLFAERVSNTFEESIDLCTEALKVQIEKVKDRKR